MIYTSKIDWPRSYKNLRVHELDICFDELLLLKPATIHAPFCSIETGADWGSGLTGVALKPV
jgi:hypothetical protein